MEQPSLATPRLLLRPFALTDAATVRLLAGDPAVADTTLNIPHPYPEGLAEQWIGSHQRSFQRGEHVHFAIELSSTGELLGCLGLGCSPRFCRAELGYWIGLPYWGCGYCTEAATAVVEYAFGERRLHRLVARHLARNPASGRVMQKLGMIYEGTAREHVGKHGVWEDLVCYGLLANDPRPGAETAR
ncbi:MAG: GNAT family N-acetyltransferase [Fimbriimonadaceae bacterium]|nr:GNAT family N-acetyltransferase [Fimbriimonadaceae bacterium]